MEFQATGKISLICEILRTISMAVCVLFPNYFWILIYGVVKTLDVLRRHSVFCFVLPTFTWQEHSRSIEGKATHVSFN